MWHAWHFLTAVQMLVQVACYSGSLIPSHVFTVQTLIQPLLKRGLYHGFGSSLCETVGEFCSNPQTLDKT